MNLQEIILEDPRHNIKINIIIKMKSKKKKNQKMFQKMNFENFQYSVKKTYLIIILKVINKGKMNKKY